MNKVLKIVILVFVVLFLFYNYFLRFKDKGVFHLKAENNSLEGHEESRKPKPKIALIFDDLGESVKDLKEIYSFKIPLTVSIIPELKFSKNIAYIAQRCNFSILIHLPLEPKDSEKYKTDKYTFISSSLSKRKIEALLRRYLNYVRIAIGVNNHMGSKATEDPWLMRIVLKDLKQRNLIFIDSRTSVNSCAFDLAKKMGVKAAYNEGFLDSFDDKEKIREKIYELVKEARKKEAIIVIAHPRKSTFEVLREELPKIKKEITFITIEEYFGL